MLFRPLAAAILAALPVAFAEFAGFASTNEGFDPPELYLTWQRDPTTTMTVHWLTASETASTAYFHRPGETAWQKATGASRPLPASDRFIHTVELTGLAAGTNCEFCFAPGEKTFQFRTMPKDLRAPLRFIEGGDVYHTREWMDGMNQLAAKFDPAFVVIGGDLAYSMRNTNVAESVTRWFDYFDSWKRNAVTPDGRLIPMLVTLGNHEVAGYWGKTPADAPGFYALFSMPGPQGYNVLDFGKYLSLLLLDSGLTHPIGGAQRDWLQATLARRRNVTHVFPFYHIPAYPSRRPEEGGENGPQTEQARDLWCPLFDRYGVKIAFEHHDHAFKRTFPLRGGKLDPMGTIYLGDGAWGVNVRPADLEHPRWYIARTESVRHFYVVTLYADQRHIVAVNEQGQIFDEVYQRVK
jgi:hypothetical protein